MRTRAPVLHSIFHVPCNKKYMPVEEVAAKWKMYEEKNIIWHEKANLSKTVSVVVVADANTFNIHMYRHTTDYTMHIS